MKLYISPNPQNAPDSNGIGRVVHAQYKHLPKLGIQIIDDPNRADVIACHVRKGSLPRVDVLHSHGLYWSDIGHLDYQEWHSRANAEIVESIREAEVLTVPSNWVAMPFKRDMRISPLVIGHGIDFDEWNPGKNGGYILWNKNRNTDVCDPMPAVELAKAGFVVHTTFLPVKALEEKPKTLNVIGSKSFLDMRAAIESADLYLATTSETFGIGTLEAMAAGVPVLGYDWCGTSDLVEHKKTGYLVQPNDVQGLVEGVAWLKEHRQEISDNCRQKASEYDWQNVMPLYKQAYELAIERRAKRKGDVTVVITSYNYANWVKEAVYSAIHQTEKPAKIIVIDDGSKDNTPEVMKEFVNEPLVEYIRQENQGVAAARNHGIGLAKTEFVTCLDADDRIAPNFVKILAGALRKNKGLGIAYSGLSFIQADGRAKGYHAWPPPFDWNSQSSPTVPPSNCIPSACMFRKEMWRRCGGYEQQYAPGEDAHFWTKGLSVGFTAEKVSQDGLHEYRTHAGSASRTKQYKRVDQWLPWMRDRQFPIGAPAKGYPTVLSYALPDISVITPVGPGHERYLPIAIESLIGQTFRNWELIVIDDTGGDELAKYIYRYPFVHIVKTPGKIGAGAARNAGMKFAKGKTVLFLDADDYLAPEALEEMALAYNQNGGKNCYIYTDWYACHDDGRVIARQSQDYNEYDVKFQHPVTALINRETALKSYFDEDIRSWEDWAYFIKLRMLGVCGKRLAKSLLYYSVDKGSRAEGLRTEGGKALLDLLKKRYKAFFERRNIMPCGSCGPSGNEIIEVKKRLGILPKQTAAEQTVATAVDRGAKMIKLEYTGLGSGSRTFMVDGVPYRAGNNVTNRIIMAKPEHVDKLLASGLFQIVQQPIAPEPVEAPKVKVAVEVIRSSETPAVRQQEAETTWTKAETAFERDVQAAKSVAPQIVKVEPQAIEKSVPKPVEAAQEVVKSAEPDFKADIEAAKAKKDKLAEAAKEMVSEYNKPVEAREMPSTLKEIKAEIPGASLDELMEWQTTEKRAAKPRKTIIAAIEEEILKR